MLFNKKWFWIFGICASILVINYLSSCKEEATAQTVAYGKGVLPDVVEYKLHVRPILSDRCYTCHGLDENARQGDFRLDTKEGAFAALGDEKNRHAIIPKDIENSVLVHRIFSDDPEEVMPPPESNLVLEDYEKEILKKWIAQGAQWKKHWSYIPPAKTEPPKVQNTAWVKNDIDRYILAKIEANNLTPNPEAEKEKLIRRLSFDLRGLPPTIQEMDDFLKDKSENAYEKLVDKLLATSDYAENMTAHWLDVARYADTHGYQDDLPRTMFPWRDWVIHAFNKNMPYDEFVTWQLAGDLLPDATKEQILATGFNRNHKITQEGGVIDEEYRVEYVADRTHTFGTAFLGLTFECSRCHDHKYDPISQKNYYSLFSFFNNLEEKGVIDYGSIPEPYEVFTKEEIAEKFGFINNADTLEELKVMVMKEMEIPRQAYVLNRGQYDKKADEVDMDVPSNILPFEESLPKNRLGLAQWLTNEKHPLFSRVTVNRFWQQLFGQGLVGTSNDFGNQGTLPTHPALLDHLALKFIENDWDVKAMMKYIVMSATYRQSYKVTDKLLEFDPKNELYARAPRMRLPAEKIRDHALAISDLLVNEVGGPSVKPYQPPGLWDEMTSGGGRTQYKQDTSQKLFRKSLYTYWKRTVPPPSMMTFDATARDLCTVQRQSTSTPLQALVLLNDPQFVEAAKVLAANTMLKEKDLNNQINRIFRLSTSRLPNEKELKQLSKFYQNQQAHFKKSPDLAKELLATGEFKIIEMPDNQADWAALTVVASTIFNLDESIIR